MLADAGLQLGGGTRRGIFPYGKGRLELVKKKKGQCGGSEGFRTDAFLAIEEGINIIIKVTDVRSGTS